MKINPAPKVLDSKHYSDASKKRWDKVRAARVAKISPKIVAIINKNVGATKEAIATEIAKAIVRKKI